MQHFVAQYLLSYKWELNNMAVKWPVTYQFIKKKKKKQGRTKELLWSLSKSKTALTRMCHFWFKEKKKKPHLSSWLLAVLGSV